MTFLRRRDVALALILGVAILHPRAQQPSPATKPSVDDNRINKAQLDEWMTKYSNWGRWGRDDERGAQNLITEARRQQAARLVKTGTTVSLARHFAIVAGATDNPFAMSLTTSPAGFATDRIEIGYHGTTITHFDALCHHAYNGKTYNGFAFADVVTKDGGCAKLGTGTVRTGIVTRAVLIDIPRLKGVEYLVPGTHVYREEIEAWEKKAGVKVSPGDALLLHTGRWIHRAKAGPSNVWSGFDASFVPFLKERDVALLGSDGAQDVGTVAGMPFPVHRFAIVALGVNIIDNMDLGALAETAARLRRWEFMLMLSPAAASNGSGGPVNPVAIF